MLRLKRFTIFHILSFCTSYQIQSTSGIANAIVVVLYFLSGVVVTWITLLNMQITINMGNGYCNHLFLIQWSCNHLNVVLKNETTTKYNFYMVTILWCEKTILFFFWGKYLFMKEPYYLDHMENIFLCGTC